LEIYPEGCPSG